MGQGAPGQIGGGLTGGMFNAVQGNPAIAPLDLSQASIFQAGNNAPNFQGQMGQGTPAGSANMGSFMNQLPNLLQKGGQAMPGQSRGMQDLGMGMQGLGMLLPFLLG
jgi:hypothetical protein